MFEELPDYHGVGFFGEDMRLEEDVWVCGKHSDEFGYEWKPG